MRKRAIITSGLSSIRHLLTQDTAHNLARSILISQLDYCNAILHGSPKSSTACCIPTVQVHKRHSTAEIVALASSSSDYSVQASCHHLQVQVNQEGSSQPLLDVARIKTVYGQRAYRILAPNTRNSLPLDIQLACSLIVFKKRLITLLFLAAFN
jgi:hypothetical protein